MFVLKKIKAFSLVEGIIAITIITLIMALAFGILSRVLKDRRQELIIMGNLQIDKMFTELKEERNFKDIVKDLGYLKIDQTCDIYPGVDRVMIVTYEIVTRTGTTIYERKHIVQEKD